MRLLFDCRSVFPGMGGIGRAAAELARELPAAMPDDEVLLLYGARRPEGALAHGPNAKAVVVEAAMLDAEFEQLALPGLLEELDADVYHGTCFAVPIAAGRAKRVATIHDVVFRRRPGLVEPHLRDYLDRWTDVSCDIADAILTVSEFSRREIATLYGRPSDRIDVVANAVDERFFGVERRRPEGRPYVLYVGVLEAKKNIAALLKAFAHVRMLAPSLPHELVLAGGGGGQPFDVAGAIASEPLLEERVRVLGHVPDDELLRLYAGAAAFAYLSEYEGFGLPPLEAMAAGVPTIVADRGSLPEVVGEGGLVVDPADSEAVAKTIVRLLHDGRFRRTSSRAAGPRRDGSRGPRAPAPPGRFTSE